MKLKFLLMWVLLFAQHISQAQETINFEISKNVLNVLKKQQVIILPALEREGCEFIEWNTQPDGTGTSYKPGDPFIPTADITLYAIWKKKNQDEPGGNPGGDEPGGNLSGDEPGENPGGEEPGENPGGEEPGENPGGDEPGENPGGDEPGENPGGDEPGENPGGEEPGENPGGEEPGGNLSGDEPGENPGGDEPGENPGGEEPGGNPGGEEPGGNLSGDEPGENPGGDEPGENPGGNIDKVSVDALICEGEVFETAGKTYTKPGTYIIDLKNQQGGDSIVTLNLKSAPKDTVVIKEHIANETHYEGYGFSVDIEEGTVKTFTQQLKNQFGCDSIVTLVLTSHTQPNPISETICKGETYTVGDKTFNKTGDYKIVLGKFNGSDIDSTQQLHLLVAEPNDTTIYVSTSNIDGKYVGNGFSINSLELGESTYKKTYKNQFGCDSTVHLVLNVYQHTVYGEDIFEEICDNETFTYKGNTYKPGKKYTLHETTALGYDSVVVLDIKSLPTSKGVCTATVMLGDSYSGNGFELPEQEVAGLFYHQQTTTNMNGCDSTATLILKVETPKDTITIPSLFTPHTRDGKNDTFMDGYEVYIYDRYGNLICHSKNGWNGDFNGKVADPGVYIYTIILKDNRKKKGTIELYK